MKQSISLIWTLDGFCCFYTRKLALNWGFGIWLKFTEKPELGERLFGTPSWDPSLLPVRVEWEQIIPNLSPPLRSSIQFTLISQSHNKLT